MNDYQDGFVSWRKSANIGLLERSAMSSRYPNFGQRRRPAPPKFQMSFKTLARITKISMAINLMIVVVYSYLHLPEVPKYTPNKFRLIEKSAELFVPGEKVAIGEHRESREVNNTKLITRRPKPKPCHKHMALFGIRKFWFTFCSYDRFYHYNYLVRFPRKFYCLQVKCWLTIDYTNKTSDLPGKDIVIFTNVDEWLTPEMWDWAVGNRTEGQRWVMMTEESPYYVPGLRPPRKYGKTAFDWIGSYKGDSDFVQPYGFYAPFRKGKRPPRVQFNSQEMLAKKTDLPLVLWLGSHCRTLHWDRMRFVRDFEALVAVKKYGKCANWPHDKEGVFLQWNNETQIAEVLSRYKFYLSLENSCCTDYITEKFWRTMQYNIVPIVVGAPLEDYERLAPPNSFIHPDQFDSLVDMAKHITKVGTDDRTYLKYFEWKKKGDIVVHTQEEYYLHPLMNATNCEILRKYIHATNESSPSYHRRKMDYFGPKWDGSCGPCSSRSWLNDKYMHPSNYTIDGDMWG